MRVLVVDHDADYRLVLTLALARHPGFEVVGEAADGAEAIAAAARCAPDLVLFDCGVPGADAFDTLSALRHAVPVARVVLISGHDGTDLHLASEATGALGWLTKDTPARRIANDLESLVGLVEAVQAALDEAHTRFGRDEHSPRAARTFVREALTLWDRSGDLEELTDSVTLLVSEVVTNAVVHADSDVEVLVRLTADAALVEVTDTSDDGLAPRCADHEATSGRGLALVDSLARRWGVRPAPGGGKTVWFEVARNG